MKKRNSLICVFILSSLVFAWSQTTATDETLPKWVIAASELENENSEGSKGKTDVAVLAAAKQIPQLILGNVTEGMNRIVVQTERFERDRYELLKKRQVLFAEMKTRIQARDNIMFSKINSDELATKLREADENIAETTKKINESLEEEKKLIESTMVETQKENTRPFFLRWLTAEQKEAIESISVWKNDINSLYKFDKTFTDPEAFKHEYEKSIISEKINGLITGKIKSAGNYLSVTMELKQYPGGTLYATAQDVGLISEINEIAYRLSNQLLPSLINTVPITLNVLIEPADVAQQSVLYIGDEVYRGSSNRIQVQPGIRNLRIETIGYKTVNIAYNFVEEPVYNIRIQLVEEQNFLLALSLPTSIVASVNVNALPQGDVPVEVSINSQKYFGELMMPDGWSSFFLIDATNITQPSSLVIQVPEEDVTKKIDRSRLRLYRAYGYVLMAMPLYFVVQGISETKQSSVLAGQADNSDLAFWNVASYSSIGVLGGCLVNMVIQLGRYLFAANDVLPKNYDANQIVQEEITTSE